MDAQLLFGMVLAGLVLWGCGAIGIRMGKKQAVENRHFLDQVNTRIHDLPDWAVINSFRFINDGIFYTRKEARLVRARGRVVQYQSSVKPWYLECAGIFQDSAGRDFVITWIRDRAGMSAYETKFHGLLPNDVEAVEVGEYWGLI